jgi:hypothetical protein
MARYGNYRAAIIAIATSLPTPRDDGARVSAVQGKCRGRLRPSPRHAMGCPARRRRLGRRLKTAGDFRSPGRPAGLFWGRGGEPNRGPAGWPAAGIEQPASLEVIPAGSRSRFGGSATGATVRLAGSSPRSTRSPAWASSTGLSSSGLPSPATQLCCRAGPARARGVREHPAAPDDLLPDPIPGAPLRSLVPIPVSGRGPISRGCPAIRSPPSGGRTTMKTRAPFSW